ncbi:ATP-binding protein [Allostreptomyces psammosilenae]|uniref:Anti-sigma regulatory factor (Ser/Thr protein kinase) n=1 Tax=Allostreptomyces psammosilenae TaxID=1892865 RepID=A0A852ZZP5_9ACTN|nr:ATP-binding protein [Allostreptomyces psammosilenae]NYI03742.1 anti-sigma regulatory factor (Ser/Thr protein kinase) [Allostreptomyces psammosilenae]
MPATDLVAVLTPVSRFLPAAPASVGAARRLVSDALADWRAPDLLDDVALCATELVTNAIQHGSRPGRAVHVRLLPLPAAEGLRLEVHDTGPALPRPCPAGPDDTRGRGLLLVSALSDAWGTEHRPPAGKVVWCEWRAPRRALC